MAKNKSIYPKLGKDIKLIFSTAILRIFDFLIAWALIFHLSAFFDFLRSAKWTKLAIFGRLVT